MFNADVRTLLQIYALKECLSRELPTMGLIVYCEWVRL